MWNVKRVVFKVTVKWTNGVTADCLLMCWLMVKFPHIIIRKLDNYLLHFKQSNRQPESVIIIDKIPDTYCFSFRRSNIYCFRCLKYFALLLYQLTDLRLPNYNSHSTQYAAVSQPDMKENPSTNILLISANELQTDGCTTAGLIFERTVRWCSSVIIQQLYMCLSHFSANVSQ